MPAISWRRLATELFVASHELKPGERVVRFDVGEAEINYFVAAPEKNAMSAIISDCGFYRYRLDRGAGRALAIIMVNPSTADAENDDPTIRKVLGFASRLDCSRIIVANKFAYRATDIQELRTARTPLGPRMTAISSRCCAIATYTSSRGAPTQQASQDLALSLEGHRADSRPRRRPAALHRHQRRQAPETPGHDQIRHADDGLAGALDRKPGGGRRSLTVFTNPPLAGG